MEKKESIKEYLQKMLDRWNKYDELDGFVAENFRVDLEKTLEYWDLRIADNKEELDKAREEGRREQAELDRTLYGVSFEHIKNADFEKILLESVDKAKENIIKDLIKKIEEAHCDSISLELLKEIDLSKLKGQ
mgnify:CR=1 FL=1